MFLACGMSLPEWGSGNDSAEVCGLFNDRQVDGFGALAMTIGLRLKTHLLVLQQCFQAGVLDGGNVYEDVRFAGVRLDEAKALVGVEKFNSASFGHAFRSSCIPRAVCPRFLGITR